MHPLTKGNVYVQGQKADMNKTGHWLTRTLLAALSLWGLVLVMGCEISGQYESDNMKVELGNTNATTQAEKQ
jgi:hypothetical protein